MGGGGEVHEDKVEVLGGGEPVSARFGAVDRAAIREPMAPSHGVPEQHPSGSNGAPGSVAPERAPIWDCAHSAGSPSHGAPRLAGSPVSAIVGGVDAQAPSSVMPLAREQVAVHDALVRRVAGLATVASANVMVADGTRGASAGAVGAGAPGLYSAPEPPRGSGLLSGQPTGGESEPWSMMGSFEDLLNGLVADEPEEEETTLPGSSRFARFFSSSSVEDLSPGTPSPGAASALSSLGGLKLDPPFDSAVGKQQDDWQQGFRALLPNVNISFSPAFGDGAAPLQTEGSLAPPGAPPMAGAAPSLGGLGGLGGFGGFGTGSGTGAVGNLAPPSSANSIGPVSASFGTNRAASSLGVGSFDVGRGRLSSGLGSAALNGNAGLPGLGSAPSAASAEISILHQLSSSSAQLPGAQLQLSSQLQSLLQGANATSGAVGSGRATSGGGETHMPGWDGLLDKGDEPPKEHSGGNASRKKEGGGNERGGKGKKRGGNPNRGGKSSEGKPPAHSGK